MALMTSRVATISTAAMMRQMTTFWIRPARMKLTKVDASHGQRIGDLGEHMVQVVAVGTGRSHDGGIGDGGAVVAHNAAGAGRRQTDGAQHRLLIVVEHLDHDGGHDADGAPGGTGGEADGRTDDEDHGGQELSQARRRRTWR